MSTKTKTKPDTFAARLAEREAAALQTYADRRDQYAAEQEQTPALHDAVSAAEDALEDTEARARAGDEAVTGADLAAARGDVDVARLRLAGSESRQRALGKWLGKAHTRSDVAEIVRGVLTARLLPGVESHATFSSADLRGLTPDGLPTLVVEQVDGGVNDEGIGSGKVKITLHRSTLHVPLDSERLRQALEGAGVQIDPSGFNRGVNVLTAAGVDEATVNLRNVADDTPLVTQPRLDAEGMDEALALTIAAAHDSLDAVGRGARIVSTDEAEGIRHTVVRLYVETVVDLSTPDGHRLNAGAPIFASTIARQVGRTTPGLGRCLEVRQVDVPREPAESAADKPSSSLAMGVRNWRHTVDAGGVYGVEFTYVSRSA